MSIPKKLQSACIVLALVVTGACAGLNQDPAAKYDADQLKEMGEKFLASGMYGPALRFLTLAEEKRPDDPVIQHNLGRAYEERGLPAQAVEHYLKALALKPDYSETRNALGVFYARQNQFDKAEEQFRIAINDPFYQTPHLPLFNLGLIYEGRGDSGTALKLYKEATRLSPRYAMAYYRMGLVQESLGQNAEARTDYARAIDCDPEFPEAHLRYGILSYEAGEIENALYSLSRVIKLTPSYSTSATEARLYLNRLNTIIGAGGAGGTGTPSSAHSQPHITDVEVAAGKDITRQMPKTSAAPLYLPPPPATAHSRPAEQRAAPSQVIKAGPARIAEPTPPLGIQAEPVTAPATPRETLDTPRLPAPEEPPKGETPVDQPGAPAELTPPPPVQPEHSAASEIPAKDLTGEKSEPSTPAVEVAETEPSPHPSESEAPKAPLEPASLEAAQQPGPETVPIASTSRKNTKQSLTSLAQEPAKDTRIKPQQETMDQPAATTRPEAPPQREPPSKPATPEQTVALMQTESGNNKRSTEPSPPDLKQSAPQDSSQEEITSPPGPSSSARPSYIVQIGSFLDKRNAEGLQQRLASKGFDVLVKSFAHQALGSVYVVQLKPLDSPQNAAAIMKNIEETERLKPILIKVRSD